MCTGVVLSCVSCVFVNVCVWVWAWLSACLSVCPTHNHADIRESLQQGVFVEGLLEENVATAEDAEAVMRAGARNRRVGSTAMNRESSRAHSVFTLIVEARVRVAAA